MEMVGCQMADVVLKMLMALENDVKVSLRKIRGMLSFYHEETNIC